MLSGRQRAVECEIEISQIKYELVCSDNGLFLEEKTKKSDVNMDRLLFFLSNHVQPCILYLCDVIWCLHKQFCINTSTSVLPSFVHS